VYRATNSVNANMMGTTRKEASASQMSRTNIATMIPISDRTPARSEVTFCETAWLMASMSFVKRLINSPAGLPSKKLTGRVCMWAKRSRRSSFRTR
jgi:hypothetical protein